MARENESSRLIRRLWVQVPSHALFYLVSMKGFTMNYKVTLKHDHYPPLNGDHNVRVTKAHNGMRYCNSDKMGCSRDYNVKTDQEAIRCFVREHGATIVNINSL